MKHKIIMSAALIISMTGMTGCFFPCRGRTPRTADRCDRGHSLLHLHSQAKTIEDKTVATGYVFCKSQYNASFPESGGTLKTIYVTAGQHVEEGDLLAELDVGDLDYLYKQQLLIVQKAQIAYNSSGTADARLTLEMEQNTLTEYERQLNNSRIYAGMTGEVCFVQDMDPGTTVTAYKTIIKIVDPSQLCIQYSSSNMKSFPLGEEVTITVDGEDYSGCVSKTPTDVKEGLYDDFPAVMKDTSSIYCEFTDGTPSFLTVGQTADITAVFARHENAVVISKTLVKTDGDRTYVTILDENDTKKEVDVTVGITNATEAEILTGLNAGDRVVVR